MILNQDLQKKRSERKTITSMSGESVGWFSFLHTAETVPINFEEFYHCHCLFLFFDHSLNFENNIEGHHVKYGLDGLRKMKALIGHKRITFL